MHHFQLEYILSLVTTVIEPGCGVWQHIYEMRHMSNRLAVPLGNSRQDSIGDDLWRLTVGKSGSPGVALNLPF